MRERQAGGLFALHSVCEIPDHPYLSKQGMHNSHLFCVLNEESVGVDRYFGPLRSGPNLCTPAAAQDPDVDSAGLRT